MIFVTGGSGLAWEVMAETDVILPPDERVRVFISSTLEELAAERAAARRASGACAEGPGGQPGNHSVSRVTGSHPVRRLFGQATPGPATTIRPGTTAGAVPPHPNVTPRRLAARSPASSSKPRTPA